MQIKLLSKHRRFLTASLICIKWRWWFRISLLVMPEYRCGICMVNNSCTPHCESAIRVCFWRFIWEEVPHDLCSALFTFSPLPSPHKLTFSQPIGRNAISHLKIWSWHTSRIIHHLPGGGEAAAHWLTAHFSPPPFLSSLIRVLASTECYQKAPVGSYHYGMKNS